MKTDNSIHFICFESVIYARLRFIKWNLHRNGFIKFYDTPFVLEFSN